jgi:hypothetical protein
MEILIGKYSNEVGLWAVILIVVYLWYKIFRKR